MRRKILLSVLSVLVLSGTAWAEQVSVNFCIDGDMDGLCDEEFTAYPECLVKIPKFADHSLQVLSKAVMYDIGGLTRWQALLEDYTSIRTYDPDRAKDPEAMERLKAKYGCLIQSFGVK